MMQCIRVHVPACAFYKKKATPYFLYCFANFISSFGRKLFTEGSKYHVFKIKLSLSIRLYYIYPATSLRRKLLLLAKLLIYLLRCVFIIN